MSTHQSVSQTPSGLWVVGSQPQPTTSVVPASAPVPPPTPAPRRSRRQAQVVDPGTGLVYRWPPQLPKAVWAFAIPAILAVLGMMAFALIFIGAVTMNIFF